MTPFAEQTIIVTETCFTEQSSERYVHDTTGTIPLSNATYPPSEGVVSCHICLVGAFKVAADGNVVQAQIISQTPTIYFGNFIRKNDVEGITQVKEALASPLDSETKFITQNRVINLKRELEASTVIGVMFDKKTAKYFDVHEWDIIISTDGTLLHSQEQEEDIGKKVSRDIPLLADTGSHLRPCIFQLK